MCKDKDGATREVMRSVLVVYFLIYYAYGQDINISEKIFIKVQSNVFMKCDSTFYFAFSKLQDK